jgi:uncharacterized membrane protein YfcA
VQAWELAGAVLLGAVAAALGTPAGVSGGLLLLPALLTGYGLTGTVAGATNLVFNIVSTPAGIVRQIRARRIDWPLARLLTGAAAPAAVGGALVNVFLLGDTRAYRLLVAVLLIAVAAGLLLPRPTGTRSDRPLSDRVRVVLIATGVASGALGGFYGLGGAVLAAPAALMLTGWPVHRVSGAALVTTLAVSVTGLATYAGLDLFGLTEVRTPHWPLGLALGAGGLIGAYVAARHALRLPDRLLRGGLAVLVTLAAVRLALV